MKAFWFFAGIFSGFLSAAVTLAAGIALVRPHAGHRGPAHWEAAAILLFIGVGACVLAFLSLLTSEAISEQ